MELSEGTGRSPWAGRYEIRELLGAGERKQVYRAHDLVMDRDVAVSLVPPEEPGPDGVSVTEWEARIMARLGDHPRIVTVYDVGAFQDQTFLVSQLMLGGELRAILRGPWRDAPPPLSRGARLGADIAEALSYAHSRNVVHRDVQPGNIWLDGKGDACLGDFDLATTPDRLEPPGAGSTVTTAAYMSPEQIAGERSLPASDLYSLGATLYELVAGRPPFEGTRPELLHDHVHAQPKPPSRLRSELGATFEDLILRLLAKSPQDRPAEASTVQEILESIERRGNELAEDVMEMISRGESHEVEFKSSLRWDYREKRDNPALQRVIAKTVAGFLNAKGGTLLIGVDPDGTVVGIERDFATLSRPNRDWWELSLTEALERFLGSDAAATVVTDYEVLDGNTVAIVRCPKRARPTWLRKGDEQNFFTRIGNSTRPLVAPFSDVYIDEHFA